MDTLKIENLEKIYSGGQTALKGVSLSIKEGDFFALLGPNGAGKTTLIGIVTGLVGKTGGMVKIHGIDIDKDHERAKTYIGVVPQEMNIDIFAKVENILIDQAGYYGVPRSEAIPRAEELLKALGLYEKRKEPSRNLSGGMKRRLMIARALVHRPKFLILDEPTAGVDVELRRGMWEYLQKINKEGTTILLTTHYLEEAEQLCKHVAIINKGDIVAQGTMKDILSHLKTETVLLDLVRPVNESILQDLASYGAKKVDDTTLSIEIGEGRGIGDAIVSLEKNGFPVQGVRTQSGKLEEVFVRLTKQNDAS
jgi:ABC-2 type transport system ATP-binding protein